MIKIIKKAEYNENKLNIQEMITSIFKDDNDKIANVEETMDHIRIYEYDYKIPELNISSTKALEAFLKWLYKDATIYLDRKYKKYLDYCRLEPRGQ